MENDDFRLPNGKPRDLKERTQRFAIEVIRFCSSLGEQPYQVAPRAGAWIETRMVGGF
jgi:hypothetical protein